MTPDAAFTLAVAAVLAAVSLCGIHLLAYQAKDRSMDEVLFEIENDIAAVTCERYHGNIDGRLVTRLYLSIWKSKVPSYQFSLNEMLELRRLLDEAVDRALAATQ